MLVGLMLVSIVAGLAVGLGVVISGHGMLLALLAYTLGGSLTLALVATLVARRASALTAQST